MREAENIDMLSYDKRDERMSDHYFFVNFTGKHLPDELKFQHYTQTLPLTKQSRSSEVCPRVAGWALPFLDSSRQTW